MKPRVLHVAPFLWSGAGRVISQLCESQQERWEVAIVTSGGLRGLRDWPAYRRRLAGAWSLSVTRPRSGGTAGLQPALRRVP